MITQVCKLKTPRLVKIKTKTSNSVCASDCSLSIPWVLNMNVSTIAGFGRSVHGRPMDFPQHCHALISKTRLLEVPTKVIHRLHHVVLAGRAGPSSVMRSCCTI